MSESFIDLVRSLPHWEFEFLVSLVFLALETAVLLPVLRRVRRHHRGDDEEIAALRERVERCEHVLSISGWDPEDYA